MSGPDFHRSVPAITEKATFEARRLIRLGWFRIDEEDDVEQDLLLHCWRKRKAIPKGATGSAYAWALLRNKARDLARHDHAPLRDRRKNDPLPEELPDDARESALPRALTTEPRYDNGIDVRRVIEQFPPPKQQFARLLADRGLVAAAEAAGISRSTAWRWKGEIRARLIEYGLGKERPNRGPRG